MRYKLLGQLEVRTATGAPVLLRRPKHRQLLAALLLSDNAIVPVDELADQLWGECAPLSARGLLQTYVWGLRHLLSPGDASASPVQTVGRGYRILVGRTELDLIAFADSAASGRAALRAEDARTASDLLSRALGLWRGAALEDVPMSARLSNVVVRLQEERLSVFEDWVDTCLSLGLLSGLATQVQAQLEDCPYRERLWGQLMLVLYRGGRRADALAAFRDLWRRLDEDLGIEPSPPVRDLHAQILAGEQDLLIRGSALSAQRMRSLADGG